MPTGLFGKRRKVRASKPDDNINSHVELTGPTDRRCAVTLGPSLLHQLHRTVMISAVIRRAVQPSLRQARPYTHSQSAASLASSKLEKGEQAIYDKLSERFQPSELLVQDISGAPRSSRAYRPG